MIVQFLLLNSCPKQWWCFGDGKDCANFLLSTYSSLVFMPLIP